MNLNGFERYCETPEVGATGKGISYQNGIKYLCEYLKINIWNITSDDILLIQSKESLIQYDDGNDFYSEFLDYLIHQHRSSYLTKGFIRAALPFFYSFCNTKQH